MTLIRPHQAGLLGFALFACGFAYAQSPAVVSDGPREAEIRKLITPKLGAHATVQSVRKTAYGALYEVVVNGDVIYTDEKAEYLFIGKVVNADTKADQTALRIGEVNKIDFADLPLDAAVKTVKGNGKRVIAVFEDPNCGYCKKLRQSFKEMDNITVYTFLYNILSPDSAAKSANIWCAPDRAKAWDDWMTNGTAPPAASDKCATPNDQVMALGKKLMVNGTPAIFFADGRRVPGFMDAKHLEEKLAALK